MSPGDCCRTPSNVSCEQERDEDEDRLGESPWYVGTFDWDNTQANPQLSGIEQKRASSLHAKIKKSVFVTQAAKSHKPGYRATGKALFVPRHDSAALRKFLETYFDPMSHISHHVSAFVTFDPWA